jgi:hypothetical protein
LCTALPELLVVVVKASPVPPEFGETVLVYILDPIDMILLAKFSLSHKLASFAPYSPVGTVLGVGTLITTLLHSDNGSSQFIRFGHCPQVVLTRFLHIW